MKKLKMKSKAKKMLYTAVILLIFLSIGIFSTVNIIKQKNYEKTVEYQLLQIGYEDTDTKILIDKYKDKEITYILNSELNNIYLDLLNDKYFIYSNFYDYLEYYKNNNGLTRDIVEIVNTKRNNEYYTNTEKADTSKKELMLVNKYYYLDDTYVPDNLVNISTTYAWGDKDSQKVTQTTYDAFLNMWNAAYNEGYYLMISSSYRTYEKQELVYNNYQKSQGTTYADSIAARPGYSEHQTGYTLDIFEKYNSNQKTFENTDAYEWLKNNSYKYGFILRYPKDKEDITGYSFESWHYRYVGVDASTYIYENNITFDEYYAYFLK